MSVLTKIISLVRENKASFLFSQEQAEFWTVIEDINDSIERLCSDELIMKPNNSYSLEERQLMRVNFLKESLVTASLDSDKELANQAQNILNVLSNAEKNAITISKTESGFAIKFPFDLKDNFRENFKSAKWNASAKQWEVGSRSGKKLEQWAQTAQASLPSAEQEAEFEERAMLEKELEALNEAVLRIANELARKTRELKDVETLKAEIAESKALLNSKTEALAKAEKAVEDAKLEAEIEADKIYSALNEVISIEEAKRLGAAMSRVHKNVDRVSKEKFEDARSKVKEMRDALKLAGLRCYAIDFIASANVNRADRDNPAFLTEKDWLNVSAIVEE
jgi:hypothetical protein